MNEHFRMNAKKQEETEKHIKYGNNPVEFIRDNWIGFNARNFKVELLPLLDFQIEYINHIHNNQNSIINKSRQMHLTSLTAAYCAWCLIFKDEYRIGVISTSGDGAQRFIKQVRIILQNYSSEFFHWEDNFIRDNKKTISLSNFSSIKGSGPAIDACRGESLSMVVFDEAAYLNHIDMIWMAIGMALSCIEGSKAIMISSPNYKEGLFYKTWLDKENDFAKIKLHWMQHPVYKIDAEERADRDGNKYWWSPWYEDYLKRLNYKQEEIDRELECRFIDKPEIKDQRVNLRLKANLFKELLDSGKIDDTTISDYIRNLIKKDLRS